MEKVETQDLYEASFYLLNGLELSEISCLTIDGRVCASMSFSGANLAMFQLSYLEGRAQANLFAFRRTYSRLCAVVRKTVAAYKRQHKAQQEGGHE